MSDEEGESYKLIYFNHLGVGEPARLMFKMAEVPFEDVRLAPNFQFTKVKEEYPRGRLPVLQIEEEKIGNSSCICRFLAQRLKLTGANDIEAAHCDEVMEDIIGLRNQAITLMSQPPPRFTDSDSSEDDFASNPPKFNARAAFFHDLLVQVVPGYLSRLGKILDRNSFKSGYLVGSQCTWADIYLAATMEFVGNIIGRTERKQFMKDYPKIKDHFDLIFSIPQISDWVQARPVPYEEDAIDMLPFLVQHTI